MFSARISVSASLLSVLLSVSVGALAEEAAPDMAPRAAPAGAEVYIISPADGDTVSSPVTVRFGLRGMGVAPAGIDLPNTGHHHLLIDVDELPAAGQPISADAQHVHFGKGQTETELKLAPGDHVLRLILGDFRHIPLQPMVVSKPVRIHVNADATSK